MQVEFSLFPGGVHRALTMSFDDGKIADVRLAELFKKYGIKGTFHYNSANIGKESYVNREQVQEIGKFHEVSAHGKTHPFLDKIPMPNAVNEVLEDKRALEKITGGQVRGMSYPYGTYSDELLNILPSLGIEYSRTINNTKSFYPPMNFLAWDPTCHQSHDLDALWEKFMKTQKHMRLFYIWGHSYEFDRDDTWERMEAFCEKAGNRDDIWYATNIEIVDYLTALRGLKFSAAMDVVYNPFATDVWLQVDKEPVKIPAGGMIKMA